MAGTRKGRRRFGWVRRLPSGRYQVSYKGPDGQRHPGPRTFANETEADRWLVNLESSIMRDEWTNPERAKVTLTDYAIVWIEQRPKLRPRTVELYRWLLKKHITPTIGGTQLGKLDSAMIRKWRTDLLASGVSETVTAKSYRFIRAVLATAVTEDRIITRNPCQMRGAATESPDERPVISVAQVFELASRMTDRRFSALVLLAAFATLRWGEITALRRRDIAPDASEVTVAGAFVELPKLGLVYGPPKSRAGLRTITIPKAIRPAVLEHLEEYVGSDPDAWVFTGKRGNPLRRGNFNGLSGWVKAVAAIGCPGLHFHDLRHTGNTLASRTRASTKDLMARMGHDSPRAAMIYQHASAEVDREIASALSDLVDNVRGGSDPSGEEDDDGTAGVLVPA